MESLEEPDLAGSGSGKAYRINSAGSFAQDHSNPDVLWLCALAILAVGILLQARIALTGGWVPAGDDAYWSMMARSVFSSHPPLLGSSSSGGSVNESALHHLGPLGFYLLAPFVTLLGGIGVAIGSAVVNASCAVVASLAVRIGVGRRAGWLVISASALLAFAMGSELLIDPWNPHLATFPLWCALCCCWAVLRGSAWWGVPGVIAASISLQTHLSFVPHAGLAIIVLLVGSAWACTRAMPKPHAPQWSRWLPFWTAVMAGLLLSLPVLIQQFLVSETGNVTTVLLTRGAPGPTLGLESGMRVMSQVFDPTNWMPGGWFPQVIEPGRLASVWVIVGALAVLLMIGVLALQSDSRSAIGPLIALLGLLLGILVAMGLPVRLFGIPMALVRWAWPVALFATVVALDAIGNIVAGRRVSEERVGDPGLLVAIPDAPLALRWSGLAVVVLLSLANLMPRDEGSGSATEYRSAVIETLANAGPRLARLDQPFIAVTSHPLAYQATAALMELLDQRGVSFALGDPIVLRQAGTYRSADGSESATVVLAGGSAALTPPAIGFERISSSHPLSPGELGWFFDQRKSVEERLPAFIKSAPNLGRDLSETRWATLLCSEDFRWFHDSIRFERSVIGAHKRERLCALNEKIEFGAVAVDLGPPP